MQELFGMGPELFVAAVLVSLLAGFVKGAVGFAMPLIMISGMSMFLPAPIALAALIFSTLFLNVAQAFRQGVQEAVEAVSQYKRLIATMIGFILLSAPLVAILPSRLLFLILGVAILVFSVTQLLGKQLVLHTDHRDRAEYIMGAVAGFFGGISGVWGPPVIAYLISFNTPKAEGVRVQGVVFLIGGVILMFSHLTSGVLNAQTAPLSVAMLVPAGLGMWLGFKVQDRLDPVKFRKITLFVLALAAANLIRKGVFG